ncbi:GNAT family N-acetyltransferase [Butyrivibrio sp. INlla16]|uniref:GNAT family N-acetyltransferase n=1 Tax=Butyrivibrio sp. INlla16 TaxID=1520807 RepID=UPI000880684F|nr:GNAT family N-acetyltransferase [Butyrivibrio sp. INlla16]SDB62033.1 Acetyltransferase (GNAT) domain-containing protein [Butyrivibrio sp. INlla16]
MIRAARETDFGSVKNITQTTIWSVYPKYYPSGAVQFFSDHHSDDRIKADIDAGKVFLLEVDGNGVGTVTVSDNEINRLFVLPDFQRKGYGRELMDFAEEMIRREHDHIILDASLPAKQLYLKRGYVATKYNMIETENGDYLCFDVMEKHL